MLQCSGDIKTPSILNILMCTMDVVFNSFLIFPTRQIRLAGQALTMPGAGLGVTGAALGTALADVFVACAMMWAACRRSDFLRLDLWAQCPSRPTLWVSRRKAYAICRAMGLERQPPHWWARAWVRDGGIWPGTLPACVWCWGSC